MHIIGFSASPRRGGNTAWAVDRILEGARTQGAQTQAWYAGELDLQPCTGCLGCVQADRCVIQDDMQPVYDALAQADAPSSARRSTWGR